MRSSRGRRSSTTSSVVHLHMRGARAAPGARDGAALPPPGAVHRPQRAARGQRGPGRLHPGVPVATSRGCSSRPAPARRRLRQRDAARRPRVLLARDVGRGDARRDPGREDGHRPVQHARCRGPSATASSTSSQIDLAVEGDVPPYEHAVRRDRRRRAADRRVRRRPRPRRRHAPARHRRRSRRRRRSRCATSATSASTPRCSPTRSSTSSRPA